MASTQELPLTKKFIKSFIPKKFYDGSNLNGISLSENSYDLYKVNKDEFSLRTTFGNPLLNILRKHFKVVYDGQFWGHYSKFKLTKK